MLKAALTKEEFEKLGDAEKGLYAEADSLYLLQVEAVTMKAGNATKTFALEDTAGLRSALSKERTSVEALTGKVKKFEELTDEPHVYLDAVKKVKEFGDFKDADARAKAQLDAHKAQLEATYANDIAKLKSENQGLAQARDKAVLSHAESVRDGEARRAFAQHKVLTDFQDVLLDKVRAATRVKTNEDGTFAWEVVDENGMARLTNGAGSTEKMSIAEFVGTFKNSQALAVCFEGTPAHGAGAGSAGGRGGYKADLSKMTGPQLMEYCRINGIKK